MENFRINNNILGEYSLIKDKKDFMPTEFLFGKLIEKMGKTSQTSLKSSNMIRIEKKALSSNETFRESIKKVDTFSDTQLKYEKTKNKYFEGIKYGVILNKKLKQYILLNFDMDFRVFDKIQKKLIHEYNILFDKANEEVNENEEFFFIKKAKEFINVIEVNENFLCIFSYNFFVEYDEIGKKTKDLIRYIKKNESKFFILFK